MSAGTQIEEIDSEDQRFTQRPASEEPQFRVGASSNDSSDDALHIEDVETQKMGCVNPLTVRLSHSKEPVQDQDAVRWTSGNPSGSSGLFSEFKVPHIISRPKKATSGRPFADLPKQLADAVARLQCTRSMHSNLESSNVYSSTAAARRTSPGILRLQVTEIVRSCGNLYVRALDNEKIAKYVVHLPRGLTAYGDRTTPAIGDRLTIEKPYVQRSLGDGTRLISLAMRLCVDRDTADTS